MGLSALLIMCLAAADLTAARQNPDNLPVKETLEDIGRGAEAEGLPITALPPEALPTIVSPATDNPAAPPEGSLVQCKSENGFSLARNNTTAGSTHVCLARMDAGRHVLQRSLISSE